MIRAVALYSGGLDSTLAIALMHRLGIQVLPLVFTSPFSSTGNALWRQRQAQALQHQFGAGLIDRSFAHELLDLVKHPRSGRGKHLNPCIDCHALMARKAKALMPELGAHFVFTGEVLGQRPMSQHRQALQKVERLSGLEGLLLRPLSAQWLEPTLPELQGWVPREKLLGIKGRGRKEQLALASAWGVSDFGSPAGGCLLTDAGYTRRLRDLMASDMLTPENCAAIRHGRYFSLPSRAKLLVARNQAECRHLEDEARAGDLLISALDRTGPLALLRGRDVQSMAAAAAGIVVFFCRADHPLRMEARDPLAGTPMIFEASPLSREQVEKMWIR